MQRIKVLLPAPDCPMTPKIFPSLIVKETSSNAVISCDDVLNFLDIFFNAVLEMSFGTKKISTLLISTNLKTILISLTLTFGGMCIHSQMLSILPNDFNYKITLSTWYMIIFFLNDFHLKISSKYIYLAFVI